MKRLNNKQSSLSLNIWELFLPLLVVANLADLKHNFICWVITLSFFLLVPGFLLLKRITNQITDIFEIISFSLGLSLLIMILGGLALNSLHAVGLERPLTAVNIYITLDLITLICIFLNNKCTFNLSAYHQIPSKQRIIFITLLTILPLLAVGGAIRLNNGASNVLTMLLFGLIGVLFIFLVSIKKLIPIYPYAIIMIGLSVLLSTSLRGWYITGHDIQNEFYVFQLTDKANYWNISSYRDPYNACLSITILPTLIHKITSIPSTYIYKAVFQAIFAFGLLPIFLFIRRLSNARMALLGSFLFISFPTFLEDLSFLNRQEIAFIFFGLLMLTTFLKLSKRTKIILSVLGLVGIILSHYSTSYVTLGGMTLAYCSYKLINIKSKNKTQLLPLLSLPVILIAFLLTFMWNAQVTGTTTGLSSTIAGTFRGLLDHSGAQSTDVSYSLFSTATQSPPSLLASVAESHSASVEYIGLPNIPLSNLGQKVSGVINVENLNYLIRTFCAKILQVLLLIGVIILFLRRSRNNDNSEELYFISICIALIIMLILQTLLPQLSVSYGSLRFFQQALIILAIPIIIAFEWILSPFKRIKTHASHVFFALLFLELSGFLPQLVGGYPAQLSLNNNGFYYDAYYIHAQEVYAEDWLASSTTNPVVSLDQFAKLRLNSLYIGGQINTTSIFNSSPENYLYLDYANVTKSLYTLNISGDVFEYKYQPATKNINLLYVNNGSKIYGPSVSK